MSRQTEREKQLQKRYSELVEQLKELSNASNGTGINDVYTNDDSAAETL